MIVQEIDSGTSLLLGRFSDSFKCTGYFAIVR